jgi:hypothetical protein
MTQSYLEQIQEAFLKLDTFHLGGSRYDGKGYQSFEKHGDNIVITLDTRKVRLSSIGDGEEAANDIAKLLKAQGIEDAKVTNQYSDFDNPGKILDAVPEGDNRLNDNKAKLVVTLPDTLDSVVKLKAAYRSSVVEAAAASVANGIQRAEKMVTETLGKQEAGIAMKEIFEQAGISKNERAKG